MTAQQLFGALAQLKGYYLTRPIETSFPVEVYERIFEPDFDPILVEFRSEEMRNERYTILVRAAAFGMFKIDLCDCESPTKFAPEGHGNIVETLDTYNPVTLMTTVIDLAIQEDPVGYVDYLRRDYNSEGMGPGYRVRLDNLPGDRTPVPKEEDD
jgi:hypothetical protein